jgi:predicted extracellular nuclease
MLDDLLIPLPQVNSGDRFSGPVTGIMDYNYGNFKVLPIRKPQKVTGSISTFDVPERDPDEISIAVYNLENLDPSDPPSRFQTLGKHIVDILKSPDILGLVEIQDNTGPLDDQVVDASLTYKAIINAILENGGPVYEFRDIPPLNNRDGGETGGNIRVGFLFRTDRGVAFWDKPGGDAVNEVGLNRDDTGVSLTANPGRIQPNAYAFFESRKPLVGEFVFRGQKIFVILNHFNSKGGDTALFGSIQPPVQNSEFQRKRQAQAVHDFATEILQLDPDARIIIMGDLNDFQFSETLTTLMGRDFTNLISILPPEQQYTYIYEGNAQVLDHMVVSRTIFESLSYFDVVHLNSIYHEDFNLSDHDPLIAIFEMK